VVAFRDLLDVSPGMFGEAAQRWQRTAEALRARAGDLDARLAGLSEWSGAAADAARSTFATYRKQLTDAADVLNRIPPVFHTAGPVVGDARSRLLHAVDEARSAGLEVNADTGQVTLSLAPANPRGADLSRQAEIQEWIDNALADATRADNEAADALRNLTAQYAGFAPDSATVAASATAIPPPGTAPAEVRKWWDALSPMQQESLLFTHEAQLGQLDGLPTPVRDRANRSRLAEQRARLEADQIRLTGRRDLTESERAQLDDINAKLNGIKSIELRLHTPDPTKQPAFLLGFDTTGTGRAIVAAGNPDTAVNVATYVPGTGANLGSIEGLMDRSDRMLDSASKGGSPSTAVITWVGYDAPQNLSDAASETYADGAKRDLDRFQDGLRATHEGQPSHNTLLGHSYGSTVIGHTARDEHINADDIVFLGSPGVGVDHANELDFPAEHIHATVAHNDIIQIVDVHGASPAAERFGASVFTSNPGRAGPFFGYSVEAHSQYWDNNSHSLANFGRIIAGKPTY
jgi:uncharacterized protein YukE